MNGWGFVFVTHSQPLTASRKSARRYDGCTSGALYLNTPRVITNQAAQVVWRWDQTDPFAGNVPDENPSGVGAFTFNLRFPGQYFDRELNTHYNYFRDYDPSIGRYVQSDPIGFAGGISTYAYVGSDPLSYTDPSGERFALPIITGLVGAAAGGLGNAYNQFFVQKNCKFNWASFGLSVGFGAATGALLPVLSNIGYGGVGGVAVLGAVTNTAQYLTQQSLSGGGISLLGLGGAIVTGTIGGAAGGAFVRSVWYGTSQTGLPAQAAAAAYSRAVAANAGITPIVNNVLGAIISNFDPTMIGQPGYGCGCNQ